MAGREDKYTTRALMGEGKLSMPSFKKIPPAQQRMEAKEAQDARDAASEKTLTRYRKDLPIQQIQTDDEGTYKSFPRRPGTLDEFKKGGSVKKYASGGSIRGGGCETRGKTKGRFV